ncbi:MAG: calcium/sodium antiporter [Gemmatimonadetes bacterium]|nr:calcium/sodium antiporter [Gemmatimonadota bacterium]
MTVLLILGGLVLLVGGAELLVRGATRLASAAGIPSLVIGLTVVAFGTSAPEMAVSVGATLQGDSDIALGNVVGSNIFNVLFILGASALVAPLVVDRRMVREQVPLMVAVSGLLIVLALDGSVGRIEGLVLFGGVLAFTTFLIRRGRRESTAAAASAPPMETIAGTGGVVRSGVYVAAGLALLVAGAHGLVTGAQELARAAGLSELVIGLTVVAAGTSLPELATSIVATLRGERDIAVGNVVGSNIFNILAILGVSAMVASDGVTISPGALTFDLPVMTAVAVACLPVFIGGRIDRWEGGLFLAFYVAYAIYLGLDATNHGALDEFRAAMIWFVLPLTVLTLVVTASRAFRSG